jgi:hypothetical protein
MNSDGSGQTRLTNDNLDYRQPSWSPDGTKIAFSGLESRGSPDDNYEIYVMNAADGSGVTRLTHDVAYDSDSPNWSPDGTKIAFSNQERDTATEEIYVMNAEDGSGLTKLSEGANPSWSPDGTKIAFDTARDGNIEIYVMNAADGSGQTNISNNPDHDFYPDWGPATELPEEDTTPPTLTVPDDMVVEANSTEGAEVTYTVTAQDNVDGTATLEEDGSTITQDNIGGDINISCEPASGTIFPIGNTRVECSATDEAGNEGTESFTVTVNPPSPSPPTPIPSAKQIIDRLISTIQNLDNDNVPQGLKTNLTSVLKQASNILTDDNPNNDEPACGKFDSFINQVNAAERRDTLTADQADDLRTQAEDITIKLLDC